jgi:hypothetical protein
MGFDIHVTASPWLAQPSVSGGESNKQFNILIKKWDNVGLTYVNWIGEIVTLKCFRVASLSSTSTSDQVNFWYGTSDRVDLVFSGFGGSQTQTFPQISCKDHNPTTGYLCYFQVTSSGYTTGNSHGVAVDSSFSLSWSATPTVVFTGLLDQSGTWTARVNTAHSLNLAGMSNVTFDDPQIVIDSPDGTGLSSGGGEQTTTDGAYSFPSAITVANGGASFRAGWVGLEEAAAARPASVTSSTVPAIGYALSSSDTGHRLSLDTGRHVVSTIANGQAPSTVVACPSVTLKTLQNDRNLTAIATEGLSFSFGLNEAGTVTYGFLRSVKVKWAITTFTYGGNRFKIDSSTDGSGWVNKASVIIPSESGTMTVDIGTMTGANYFRFYFDDGGTAATITLLYVIPVGIQPGSPIDIVDAATGLPPTSEEVYSIPTPPQTFDGAVDTYRDLKILNRHPTLAYTVELVNLSTGISGGADAVLDFTNLAFQNTSDVPISPQITVAAASSTTVRMRYVLASGNPLDGLHAGRIGARLVRTLASDDIRIFLANGSTDDIWAYDRSGVRREIYTGSGITPAGIAVDPYTQELYLLHAATGTTITVSVWKLGTLGAPDRTLTITGGGISSDTWTTITAWHGYIMVGGSGTAGKIIIAGTKGTSTPYVTALTMSSLIAGNKFMAVSPEGYLFVSTGTSARTVDQWNLWTNTLVRTLNSGAQVAADHTGLMFDYRNREISIQTQGASVISFIRFHGDTGSFVQTKQKTSDANSIGAGIALLIADREYHAYSNAALLWTSLKSHSGYDVATALSPNFVGSAPYSVAWLA